MIRTVGELREALEQYRDDQLIIGTWEGIFRSIHVYASHHGVVFIDVDRGDYEDRNLCVLPQVVIAQFEDEESDKEYQS